MSVVLIILLVVAGIILLFLITALFIRKDYVIKRQTDINAPQQVVFDYIKMLRNQDYYSKWVMTDPEMKKEFNGTDGTVGFVYGWDGNKQAGAGEQEIKSVSSDRMTSEVRFVRPFPGLSVLDFGAEALDANRTRVTWQVSSVMKFPLSGMLPMIKNMLAKDMDTSLSNLKRILEK